MNSMQIVRLTPSGRGAVASFLLCGNDVDRVFALCWHGKLPDEQLRWGRLRLTDTGDCEEAVVHRTAEGIEMHVHGGDQVASAIELLFQQHGAVCKTWQEHFTAGTSQRELALRFLPFAPTKRTAQILLDQYNGASDRQPASQKFALLGKHLVEPFRVVLAGASNAGKSSLLNAILGFQRSLVHFQPGTTRDVVSGQTALDGFPVTFFDTAGFRETGDDLELQGINRSLRSLAGTDLVIWVIDLTVEKSQRPTCPAESNVMMCYNKIDLVSETIDSRRKMEADLTEISVSALTGEGIETLLDMVIRRLVPYPPKPGMAVPILVNSGFCSTDLS